MIDEARLGIYDYVENLLVTNVTENVYLMDEPTELTDDDETNGFIVVNVGDFNDASEFKGEAFAYARVFLTAYVPAMSRGRVDRVKYKAFEDGINGIVSLASQADNIGMYWIDEDSILSADGVRESNQNVTFFTFLKSFIVIVGVEPTQNN